jgi:hypothetical protein
MKTCTDCNGDRVVEKGTDDEQQCPTCGGFGFVSDDDDHEEAIKTSPICRGRKGPAPSGKPLEASGYFLPQDSSHFLGQAFGRLDRQRRLSIANAAPILRSLPALIL